MHKREKYKRLILFLSSLLVVGLQTANFAYIWFTRYNFRKIIGPTYWNRGNWALIGLYALIVMAVSKLFGALKVGYMRVLDVVISQILSVLLVNVITYLQLALIGRWKFMHHITPMIWLTFVNLIVVLVWVVFARWIYAVIYPPRQTILVYDERTPDHLIKTLASCNNKYVISEMLRVTDGMEKIFERIPHYEGVILGDLPAHERNLIIKYCFEKDIRCYSSEKISDIMIMSAEKIHMYDTPLLLFRNRGLSAEQQLVKRICDVVCSAAGLVLLSPVFLIIALLIKCYDHGPVFYSQDRLTQGGRVFKVLKFRSMRVDSEAKGARLAMKDDDRVTPVGRVLRNIHFDELPQLINILRGDMSIVGPRPERPQIAAEYQKELPEFEYRLKVKAGLTGYAQVYGKYNTTPYDKLKLDLTYIQNYSLFLDLQLVAATIKILFQKENTEGVEQWQKTASRCEDVLDQAEEQPTVTVCIPCYNGEATLGKAIESALNQKYVTKVIVVDDVSTDGTAQVVRQWQEKDDRVTLVRNEKSLGASGSRNKAVAMADTEYVAFLDADDYWMPKKIKMQVTAMRLSGSVLSCTGRELMSTDGYLKGRAIGVPTSITYRQLMRYNCINCSSVVIRTDVAKEFPMEHEDSHEDYIAWLKIVRKYGTAVGINEPLLKYRVSVSGKSGSKFKSAGMTWRVYRYMGFGPVRSIRCFISYALYGVTRYFL
ncbi:MAG: exopolysaccharide biosynthesis polyprenyl glycosylphosphotransferase [Lachnospiraceae bacterium]|nr:exopolysaccharide biosynthesis polyprenyl glycosylphosphotransferase [Lachnospiraceae bacterium]